MKHLSYYVILSLSIIFLGCTTQQQPKEETLTETAENAPTYPDLLQKALDAHGGLDKWRSFRQLSYDWNRPEGEADQSRSTILDLQNRREKITAAKYEMGYDGENYWHKAVEDFEGNLNPKFTINLEFYFFAMPFVLADPGVNYENIGQKEVGENTYDVLKITFNDGTGVAPKDQYLLHFNPETHRLELLLYSVTYFNTENAEKYNARKYEEWQEIDGLWIPLKVISYRWDSENNQLGDLRSGSVYSNVTFETEAPVDEIFAAPEGAEIAE